MPDGPTAIGRKWAAPSDTRSFEQALVSSQGFAFYVLSYTLQPLEIQEIIFTEARMQKWSSHLLDGAGTYAMPRRYIGFYQGHEFTATFLGRDQRSPNEKAYPFRYKFKGYQYFRLRDVRDAIHAMNARITKIMEQVEAE